MKVFCIDHLETREPVGVKGLVQVAPTGTEYQHPAASA